MSQPSLYTKRDGNFYFTFRGKQYYGGTTAERAQAKVVAVISGQVVGSPSERLSLAIAEYLASLQGNQTPDTIYTKKIIYRHLLERFRDVPVSRIDTGRLESYKRQLLEDRKKSTVRSIVITWSAFFGFCVERRWLKQNPVRKMTEIKVFQEVNPDYLTEEEIVRLLSLCDHQRIPYASKRDRLLFLLMLRAGLRRIEVQQLQWGDIDFDKRVIAVRGGKGGKNRLVAINQTLLTALQEFPRNGPYVIPNIHGSKISRGTLTAITRKYLRKLNHHYKGRKRFSLHSLRATFATTLCEKGVSTRVVQQLLGHSDPKTTMRYACATEAALVDAVGRLG